MEKLFFSITRWLMLIGTTIIFVFLVGGAIYAFKLYQTSLDTQVRDKAYHVREPNVSFNKYRKMHQDNVALKEKQRSAIEHYVLQTIENGSSGHGFSMGSMPSNMLKGKNAKIVARYVSERLTGNRPIIFGACAACHGEDGKGMGGISPSLLSLPIYNGLASKATNSVPTAPGSSQNSVKKYTNPLKQYSAKLASIINKYAITVGQEGTTVDHIFNFIKELKNIYNTDAFQTLQVQLDTGLKSLLIYAEQLRQNKNDTKEAIQWKDFLDWFLNDFNTQIKEENKKYQQSKNILEQKKAKKISRALEARFELSQLLIALGVALISFILLTMILVLLKIEKNSRHTTENKGLNS